METHLCSHLKEAVAAAYLTLTVFTSEVHAQETIKSCPRVIVASIDQSPSIVRDLPIDAKQATIETIVSPVGAKYIIVMVRGPVLGSMDSEKVNTDLACTTDGFALTATITRSANYHGDVMQNLLWSPEIKILIRPLQAGVILQTVWKLRLSNGKQIDRARTPPYAEQEYPIRVRQRLELE